MSDDRINELFRAVPMQSPRRGFAERTMRAIAAAEQTRRLRQVLWSVAGAGALSTLMTAIVVVTGFVKVGELTTSFALFASKALPLLSLASRAVQSAPLFFVALSVPAIFCCALATLLLERSVRNNLAVRT